MIKIKFEVDRGGIIPSDEYWKKLPDLPVALTNHSVVNIGDDVYVLFGIISTNNLSSSVYKLAKDATEWELITPTSTTNPTGRQSQTACVIDKKIYVFGGANTSSSRFNQTWVFDTEDLSWTQKNNMDLYRANATSVVRNGNIIIIGGIGSTSSSTAPRLSNITEYIIEEDAYYTVGNLPTQLRDLSATYDERTANIYIYGGFTTVGTNSVYVIDPTNTVTTLTTHEPARYNNENILRGNKLFSLFGRPDSPCEKYNFDDGSWIETDNNPTGRHSGGSANISDGIVYVGGNSSVNNIALNEVWQLVLPVEPPIDPDELVKWEKLPDLPVPLYGHSMVEFENKLYVYGGIQNGVAGTVSNKIYQYDLETDSGWVQITGTGTSHPAVQSHGATVSPDGWMYIAGGTSAINTSGSTGTSNAFSRFNLRTRVWQTLPALSTTIRVSKIAYWNNFIIFSRGLNVNTQVVLPNTYNILDGTYTTPFAGNTTREYFSGLCNANGQLHNHGGARTAGSPNDSVPTWRHTKGGNWVVDIDIEPSTYSNDLVPFNDDFIGLNGLIRNATAAAFVTKPNSRFFRFNPDTKTRTVILPPPEHKCIYQFASASKGNTIFQSGGQYNTGYNDPTDTFSFSPNNAANLTTRDVWKATIPDYEDNTEGTWEKLPDYPNTYGSNPIVLKSVVVNGFLYTFTAIETTPSATSVYKMNISTNTWTKVGDFSLTLDRGNSSIAAHDGIIYFYGAYGSNNNPTSRMARFSTETDTFIGSLFTSLTPAYGTAGVTIGDEIWFIGGYASGATNIARVHNPVLNTWREEAMAGTPNTWFGTAINYDGQPSIGFGDSSVVANKSRLYIRDEQGNWGVKAIIPNQLPKVFGRLNKIGRFVYISGFGNTSISNFSRLDTERNTWVTTETPFTAHQFLSTADDGNSIFILCGRNESSMTTPVRDVWKFTPKYK